MQVKSCSRIVEEEKLHNLISPNSKLPDHNLLIAEFALTNWHCYEDKNIGSKEVKRARIQRKVGETYMKSDTAVRLLPLLLYEIYEIQYNQTDINCMYDDIVKLILTEAENSMCNTGKKRRGTKRKDFWDLELSKNWSNMSKVEKAFRAAKKNANMKEIECKKKKYRQAQKIFDKTLKAKKHAYCKGVLIQMKACSTRDPTAFWDYVKKLGPKVNNSIPWEVEIDGEPVFDKKTVLNRWKSDFESLYRLKNTDFNDEFKQKILTEINNMNQEEVGGPCTQNMNKSISYNEVKRASEQTKVKKAVGLDAVANELLRDDNVIKLLYHFFRKIFELGLVPEIWKKAIIHLIPKESGKLIDPLKYLGLALQCCMYKVFSSILNERIVQFLNDNELLNDEQNGFRKGRSCKHHIYTLVTLLRQRLAEKKTTFCTFVDFKKAFDVTDRE